MIVVLTPFHPFASDVVPPGPPMIEPLDGGQTRGLLFPMPPEKNDA